MICAHCGMLPDESLIPQTFGCWAMRATVSASRLTPVLSGKLYSMIAIGLRQHRELTGRAQHDVTGERGLVVAAQVGGQPIGRHVLTAERRGDRDEDALDATHTWWSPTPRALAAAPGQRPAGRWES